MCLNIRDRQSTTLTKCAIENRQELTSKVHSKSQRTAVRLMLVVMVAQLQLIVTMIKLLLVVMAVLVVVRVRA